MARRRQQDPDEVAEERGRSGWAHFERVAEMEVRFIEWCPDVFGDCGSSAHHAWRTDPRRLAELRRRFRAVGP